MEGKQTLRKEGVFVILPGTVEHFAGVNARILFWPQFTIIPHTCSRYVL